MMFHFIHSLRVPRVPRMRLASCNCAKSPRLSFECYDSRLTTHSPHRMTGAALLQILGLLAACLLATSQAREGRILAVNSGTGIENIAACVANYNLGKAAACLQLAAPSLNGVNLTDLQTFFPFFDELNATGALNANDVAGPPNETNCRAVFAGESLVPQCIATFLGFDDLVDAVAAIGGGSAAAYTDCVPIATVTAIVEGALASSDATSENDLRLRQLQSDYTDNEVCEGISSGDAIAVRADMALVDDQINVFAQLRDACEAIVPGITTSMLPPNLKPPNSSRSAFVPSLLLVVVAMTLLRV